MYTIWFIHLFFFFFFGDFANIHIQLTCNTLLQWRWDPSRKTEGVSWALVSCDRWLMPVAEKRRSENGTGRVFFWWNERLIFESDMEATRDYYLYIRQVPVPFEPPRCFPAFFNEINLNHVSVVLSTGSQWKPPIWLVVEGYLKLYTMPMLDAYIHWSFVGTIEHTLFESWSMQSHTCQRSIAERLQRRTYVHNLHYMRTMPISNHNFIYIYPYYGWQTVNGSNQANISKIITNDRVTYNLVHRKPRKVLYVTPIT